MPQTDTSITLTLSGNPTLPLFSEATRGLNELLVELGRELDIDSVQWEIDHLEAGSSIMTILGAGAPQEAVIQITDAAIATANVVRHGNTSVLTRKVAKAARRITGVLNGVVPDLTLVSGDEMVSISTPETNKPRETEYVTAFGSLTGVIQTISKTRGLQFRILDETYGGSVVGKLDPEMTELVRDLWDRRATIEGEITRERRTGRPISMANVERVQPAREPLPGAFLRARGALSGLVSTEPSEIIIRRLRDAS
jgi:hypothetical protein